MKTWWKRFTLIASSQRGTAAVEFALATPIMFALLVPIADLGMAFAEQIQVQQAAQAGAQYAAFHPWNSQSVTKIKSAVTAASRLGSIQPTPDPAQVCGCPNGGGITTATCSSACPDGEAAGYYVVVNAQAPYHTTLPYSILGDSVTLTAQATVRIQ